MSTEIVPFLFDDFEVRVVSIDNEPWFVLTDLCSVLGLSTPARVAERLDPAGVSQTHISSGGQRRNVTIVDEGGMYEVVLRSDKPGAITFRRWITKEVLPQIRRTGSYGAVPALPDLSTPEGVLALAQTLTKTAEELVAAKSEVAELTPLAAQARTHNLGKGNAGKQAFAREIIKWALAEGFQVKQPQVIEFISRKLDMFVVGNRSDHGDATISGERRGLSTTVKGTSEHNGHAYSQGLLTPKGVEYAWSRIESYVREYGHLELPKKGIAA